MKLVRPIIIFLGLLLVWQVVVSVTGVAKFILPTPLSVLTALYQRWPELLSHAGVTVTEILLGLGLGTLLGCLSALIIAQYRGARLWVLPVLIVSQAIPVFALAPILVLWLGYGLASKVAMATLIIYFPVTVAFYDGLRRTEPGWLDLAQVMGGSRWRTLLQIRIPAALPALASGLRVAASVAPIGAIVGEWVGSSAGLGYMMLHANARLQVDVMFAALLVLALFAVALYFTIDRTLRLLISWQPDNTL